MVVHNVKSINMIKSTKFLLYMFPLFQANHLFRCLVSAELAGVEYAEDVLRELEAQIEAVKQATKNNNKTAKVMCC